VCLKGATQLYGSHPKRLVSEHMLNIRPFVEDKDEPIYIDVMNRAMQEFPDITPLTLEDAEIEKNAPNSDLLPSGIKIRSDLFMLI